MAIYLENSTEFPKSIAIERNEIISEQIKNNICKICLKDGNKGKGFFCKIPFPNKLNLLPVFITNNHIIDEKYLNDEKELKIKINDDEIIKIINIENRYRYTNQNYDITIIEINENIDKINNYLEIDYNIFNENEFNYISKSINILHYPNHLEVENSTLLYETLNNNMINNKNNIFKDNYCEEYDLTGSPILNLSNNKVIGIHRQKENKNCYIASFLYDAIKEFIKKYNENKIEINKIIENNYIHKRIIENDTNEITIKYKFDNDRKIRLFGYNFVLNNKKNCTIIINGEEQELSEWLEIKSNMMNKYILEIKLKGIKNITNMSYMFSKCSSLISVPDISNWNTINVIDMSYLFHHCSSLLYLSDISNWNTINVNNLSGIFFNCSSLLSLPDISKWNIYNVNNMKCMFYQCCSLKSLPDISKWNTNKVTDMRCMFYLCSSLTSMPDISRWNTKNVNDMSYMFCDCLSLSFLPDISKWNTGNVNKMNGLFYNCSSLTFIPDLSKWNIKNVINISCMYYGCINLININLFK